VIKAEGRVKKKIINLSLEKGRRSGKERKEVRFERGTERGAFTEESFKNLELLRKHMGDGRNIQGEESLGGILLDGGREGSTRKERKRQERIVPRCTGEHWRP